MKKTSQILHKNMSFKSGYNLKITTDVKFVDKVGDLKDSYEDAVFIADEILKTNLAEYFKEAAAKVIFVKSGEDLKSLDSFADVTTRLSEYNIPKSQMCLIAVGGGSVSDFTGFVASVYKRGIGFEVWPTTWLSAVDSAFGGKNGLNLPSAKNQLGTIYNPQRVVMIKDILFLQNEERTKDALGEIAKYYVLESKIRKTLDRDINQTSSSDLIWKYLPEFIKTKYVVVKKDPFETKNVRQLLNLGHTVGHVIEKKLKMSHGLSVAAGLRFAIEYSRHKKYIDTKNLEKLNASPLLQKSIPNKEQMVMMLGQISADDFKNALYQDKKMIDSKSILFIFLSKVGSPKVLKHKVEDIIQFRLELLKNHGA